MEEKKIQPAQEAPEADTSKKAKRLTRAEKKALKKEKKLHPVSQQAKKVKKKRVHQSAFIRFFTNTRGNRSVAGNVALLIFLIIFGIFSFFPVLFMVNNAFKPMNELFRFPPTLWVQNPTLDNFYDLFDYASSSLVPFSRYLFNTVLIVVVGTVGHILLSSMAAFPLAKFRFPGNSTLSKIVVYSLMFSPAVTAVPNYLVMSYLGLIDSYLAVILPALCSTLGLYLMQNFMGQIPDSLIEAARIDGASEFRMLWKIVMPAVKPAWITVFIFSFQGLWGNTGGNFIYTENLKPLSYMLNQIGSVGIARTGVVAATSLLMFLIPVIIFIISQSNVLETMATSGMKD